MSTLDRSYKPERDGTFDSEVRDVSDYPHLIVKVETDELTTQLARAINERIVETVENQEAVLLTVDFGEALMPFFNVEIAKASAKTILQNKSIVHAVLVVTERNRRMALAKMALGFANKWGGFTKVEMAHTVEEAAQNHVEFIRSISSEA